MIGSMIGKADLEQLTALAMQERGRAHMRPVIQKELLHYDILYTLDMESLLQPLTFQGGTSLRLCYGSNRLSEDLDFVGGRNFTRQRLEPIKDCIEHYIGRRYGLEVRVKEPKALKLEREHAELEIDKWQVSVVTAPEQKDVPQQRIKIEVANIDAYSREPHALHLNYSFLPDGYNDTLVLVESLDEIMADKLVSLVNTISYVRNRDIWDLRWLSQQGAQLNSGWVQKKIQDYRIANYEEKLTTMIERLEEIIHGRRFYGELSRFLPQPIVDRTLNKPDFLNYLSRETRSLLTRLQNELSGGGERPGDFTL